MTLADLHLPEDHDAMRQMVALSSIGQRDVKTWRHFQRNNNVIHVEVTVNRLKSGGAMAFVVLAYDVTERRNAVNALEQSEQRHREIVQISADLIFLSCNDEIIFINEAGVRLLRASDSRQIIGRSPRDFISWDAREFLNEIAMWDKPRTGAPTNVTMIADDGSHFEASARTVTYLSNGEVITQTTCFDLTALRAADRKTRQDELRFQTVFNLQFQFMVILAPSGEILMVNDLPLEAGGINRDAVVGEIFWDTVWWRDLPLMRAQWPLMLAKAAGDTSALRFEGQFSTVSNEVRDIDVAITAVRDDAGVLSYFIFQANDITGRKADELALRAGEARLATAEERANVGSWEYDFGEGRTWWSDNMYRLTGAEPGTPPFGLIGFRNFVHVNDRKIFDNEAPDATAEHYILISVTDTGEGMTREVADRAFEPFYTTKKTDRNSGLGLSMIHGFIKQSGGQVVLLSEPGFGTTIRLYLPRAPQGAALSAPSAAPPELAHGSETILVVEDDPLVRSHVLSRLAQLGYFVLEAANGHDALIILASDIAIDLLFTDVVMPGGLNGRELAIKANALRPELPVLFTSGYTENTIVHDGRLDEDVHLLSKPYRLQDLAAKIREVLFIARRAAPEPMPPLIN